jgi:hypothetical protein
VQGSGDLLTESVCRREPRRPLAMAQGARGGPTSHGQKELLLDIAKIYSIFPSFDRELDFLCS